MGTERSKTVAKVAALISASESDVEQLVEAGRLERTVLTALRGNGVKLTPSVKNSVQATVRSLKPGAAMPEAGQAPEPPSGSGDTATIMFTDIVGSTGIMERLGDREGRKLMSLHDEIVRHEVIAHDGVEVKALSDGSMLTFRSVARGLACAVAIQRDIALYNGRNDDARIAVRIGLSVGEPIQDSEDLFGMSVIMAARISASAKGGRSSHPRSLTRWPPAAETSSSSPWLRRSSKGFPGAPNYTKSNGTWARAIGESHIIRRSHFQ